MAKLTVSAATHELGDELITIGRAPENTIQIDDPSVSNRHAQLQQAGGTLYLKDLDSTNGTRVNGESVKSVALRPGDRICFGKTEACYECDPAAYSPLPAPDVTEAKLSDFSARPVDFTNASPFPPRALENDATRKALFAAALIAFVMFMVSMFAVFMMRPAIQ